MYKKRRQIARYIILARVVVVLGDLNMGHFTRNRTIIVGIFEIFCNFVPKKLIFLRKTRVKNRWKVEERNQEILARFCSESPEGSYSREKESKSRNEQIESDRYPAIWERIG